MPKKQLRQLSGARVPEFVHEKLDQLLTDIRPLGHPRALREDLIGALINAASAASAAKALNAYNPKLGEALNALDEGDEGSS